ncbi:MAG: hypothetical protein EXR98_11910 [Gemmataceae bacterium]|nr:hypothetical protein [Gemmataceae bacterium]
MRTLFLLAFALLAVGFLDAQPAKDRPHNDAIRDILLLADNLDAKDCFARAKKIALKHDSCDISQIFSFRFRGGAGIGSAAESRSTNSIDWLVRGWAGTKPPTKEKLQKHQADLIKTARVLQAMAELAPHRMPPHFKDDKRMEAWKIVAQDFKVQTRELREGIEKTDATMVNAAAVRMLKTCTACHNLAF